MVELNEYRVRWSGISGMPGVSTFYSQGTDVSLLKGKLATFYGAVKGYIPSGITITIPSSGRVIESTTGAPTAMWANGTDTAIACTGTGGVHAAGGAMVRWETSMFVNNRRLRGKTFLVPLVVAAYSSDGTLDGPVLTALQTAAGAVPGGTSGLAIWSRRWSQWAVATTGTVMDKAVVLRSRRD